MKKFDFKPDATTIMGIVGGILIAGGKVIKLVVDKKTEDLKLHQVVEEVVEQKLQGK